MSSCAEPRNPPKKLISRAEAKSLGLTRYFTGKPCPQGHVVERHVSGFGCVECTRKASNYYHITNRGKINKRHRAADRRYYARNKTRICTYNKTYRGRFCAEDAAAGWYVYLLRHPLTGIAFYVGMSRSRFRLNSHLREPRCTRSYNAHKNV